ncbi:MAG: endo-1,4-beta-xylanase [Thermoguttaceae bacterium]
MGLMRFVSPSGSLSRDLAEQAYLAGYDRIPWRVRVQLVADELLVQRDSTDSGNLYIPWRVNGHGQVTLTTTSLMDRQEPYFLPVELARGKLSQLRNQTAEWQLGGVRIPDQVRQLTAAAMKSFGQATCRQAAVGVAAEAAAETLRLALDAGELLAEAYSSQVLAAMRVEQPSGLSAFVGGGLGETLLDENTSSKFLETFNAASVPFVWREIEASQGSFYWDIADRQVEWCRRHGLKVCGGPLLVFDPWHLPEWLSDFDGDYDGAVACLTDYIQAVVGRYRDLVDVWICAARMNTCEGLSLSEHERIRLTARAVEVTQAVAPGAERLVSYDQPWGEYMSRSTADFSPLHFADALVRARLGLTGLAVELNVGYRPGGTPFRDPLDTSRHLDYWSMLGVPLYVTVTVPSGDQPDPLARRQATVDLAGCEPAFQAEWVKRYVPLFLAKPYLRGVIWSQLRDSEPHDFAHGGLFDSRRKAKPAVEGLAAICQAWLR